MTLLIRWAVGGSCSANEREAGYKRKEGQAGARGGYGLSLRRTAPSFVSYDIYFSYQIVR